MSCVSKGCGADPLDAVRPAGEDVGAHPSPGTLGGGATTVSSSGHKVLLLYLFCLCTPNGWCQGEATTTVAGEDLELLLAFPYQSPYCCVSAPAQ